MSLVDPQTIHSESHAEIGNLLATNVGVIIERWSRRAIEEQPNARRVHHETLLDHLAELLQKIGHGLAETDESSASQHRAPAARHGEQRWDAGWSLPEVVRDYQILRLVVLEFLEESLDRPLRYREVLAVGLALDESITSSVVAFVQEHEGHLKTLENARVSELKEVQARLKAQTLALQQADQRKNEFMAIVAHELRNPLAPVRNALNILRLKSLSDTDLQSAREIIERQAQQMGRMIDDLVDVSRIEHGKINLEKEPITINVVFDRAVEEVRPLIEAMIVRLSFFYIV
jgi:signal transduction histidine kinase